LTIRQRGRDTLKESTTLPRRRTGSNRWPAHYGASC